MEISSLSFGFCLAKADHQLEQPCQAVIECVRPADLSYAAEGPDKSSSECHQQYLILWPYIIISHLSKYWHSERESISSLTHLPLHWSCSVCLSFLSFAARCVALGDRRRCIILL